MQKNKTRFIICNINLYVAVLFFISIFFVSFVHVSNVQASESRELGLGVALGSPTAITGKLWVDSDHAIDFGFGSGWSVWMVYGDYHWNKARIFGSKTEFLRQLTGYIGAGAGMATWNRLENCSGRFACKSKESGTAVFIRGPVGAEWYPEDPRIGVFLEIAPAFAIIPGFGSNIDFQIGARYYF